MTILMDGNSKRFSNFKRHRDSKIYVNECFLKKETCSYIVSKIPSMDKSNEKQKRGSSGGSVFNTYNYGNQQLITFLLKLSFEELTKITRLLSGIDDIEMSLGSITEIEPGDFFWEHSDTGYQVIGKNKNGEDITRIPPRYSAVLYLNDDYDGGEFVIKSEQFYLKPKSGSVVLFDSEYLHSVNVVEKSNRYAIASFDTRIICT